MIFYKTAVVLVITFGFLSCSSDDSSSENTTLFDVSLTEGSHWVYDVINEIENTRDSIYISNDTVINTKTYKKLKTKANLATGFYSSSLRNNGIRWNDGKLFLSGDLALASGAELGLNFDLTLDDFIILNKNASTGQQLSTKNGSFQENINGLPLTITYTLKSFAGENFSNFTSPNGDAYTDVKSTIIKLNATVTMVQDLFGVPLTITVLAPQDVIVSTQYIASGIGVVHTNTDTSYSINSTIADEYELPESDSQNQKEYLVDYQIN